jgi:signal transduction histidine kinase
MRGRLQPWSYARERMTARPALRTVMWVLSRLPPAAVDAALVVAVAAAMTLTISVAAEDSTREPDLLAYALGLCVGVLLAARRRWPMGVLVASVGVLWIYYALDYPAFAPAVPLAAATYFASAAGHLRAAALLIAGVLIFGLAWQTLGEDASLASVIGINTLADASLLAAVLLLGEAVRSRRAWAEEVRARTEREAARRVEEERLRIARELHDVMAHTIAGVNVQAGVAADVIDEDPEQAKASLRAIREGGREAMAELRATVGLLRGTEAASHAPAPGLGDLDGLARMVGEAGLKVDVEVAGPARTLSGAVSLTAYRIVQESLTNVVRHARAEAASVSVRYEPDAVVVRIEDDGRGVAADGATGHGIAGMRERAAAVGGTLQAGPGPSGGFRVSARLPTVAT